MWKIALDRMLQSYTHPGWGYMHSLRLLWLTKWIAREDLLHVDLDVLYAAVYLHDLGAFPPYQQPKVDHALRSVEICLEILEKIQGPVEKIAQIQQVIRYHMFSTPLRELPKENSPVEIWVLRDADILEFLGFIGISRLLSVAGIDDWIPNKDAVPPLIRKFQHNLPPLLHFSSSQRLGQVRINEIDRYFALGL